METTFLTGDEIGQAISRLMSAYDEYHWAVAWGSDIPLARKLIRNAAKIRRVTFGISFAQTDPDLVDALVGRDSCYVETKFRSGTYHPKVYGFRSGERAAAIVGSANFTRGGIGGNLEAAVGISGSVKERALADILAFVQRSASYGEPVTPELAAQYRLRHRLAARLPKPPRDPFSGRQRLSARALDSDLIHMS